MARVVPGLVLCLLGAGCAQVGGGASSDSSSAAAPVLQSLQPAVGPTTGGDLVTIRGQNFPKDALVRWNGVLGTNIKVVSATEITALLPASASVGKVKVSVTASDGREAAREDLFAYYYGQIDFGDQTSLATGSAPTDLRVADLDGDKLLDIVTANSNDSSLSLFVGQAGGLYGSATRIALPSNPEGLTAADIDGDSKLDLLITASSTNRLYTLRNTGMSGAGLFALAATTTTGTSPVAVTTADLNGDGKPDGIIANRNGNSLSVLMNKGSATWDNPTTVNTATQPAGLAVGDVNKDGRPDVVVSSYQDGTVQLFLNNGSGGLMGSGQALMVGGGARGVNLFDFNGDGLLDLSAICENSGGAAVLLGQSGGAFASAQSYTSGSYPSMALTEDLNGDGRADLIVLNGGSRGTIVILPGQGDGTFVAGDSVQRISLALSPSAFASGDVDGDGKRDLVIIGQAANQAIVLRNKSH